MSQDHRIRLNDQDIDLIVSSLRARAAAVSPARRRELMRLAERLSDPGRGNPCWRLSALQVRTATS